MIEPELLFKVQVFCCFYLTGLIWTVQMVHYPAYHYISLEKFQAYQEFHTKWITPVVAPFMILELITAFLILAQSGSFFNPLWGLNFLGVVLLWIVTFFVSVPAHNILIQGFNSNAIDYLIQTNWIRTFLWSIRTIVLFYILTFKIN